MTTRTAATQTATTRTARGGGYGVVLSTVLGVGLILSFVFGRTYSDLALKKEPFDRTAYVPSFDPIADVTLGLSPNAGNLEAALPDPDIRAVMINPTQTLQLAGGKVVRTIDIAAPATLHELAHVIDDPDWISESGDTVTLSAAVIAANGSALRIASPVTSELVMTVRDGVFLAAWKATLQLSGVYVHASDPNTPSAVATPGRATGRPFVLAVDHATMTVDHSTLRYLGRDWNSSYGLSWSKGSSGSVSDSLLEHNFIGVYTNGSVGLKVQKNEFYHNTLYGVDPHSASSRLLVEHNIANFNGRHGIIFSDHVTAGIVRYNTTNGNGLNGIMMDELSTGNQIYGNTVRDNRSDGIVMASSADNSITGNLVAGNRVGVNVRGDSVPTVVHGNTIRDNKLASQGSDLSGNTKVNNGGSWSAARVGAAWVAVLPLLVVLLLLTIASNRRRVIRQRAVMMRNPPRMGTA